jgi:glutamate-1-semialdehyde 2,1-aminomutase
VGGTAGTARPGGVGSDSGACRLSTQAARPHSDDEVIDVYVTRTHDLVPGGAHTYAKGDDQYPTNAPGLIARGRGCRVWDTDGNEFIE